MTGEGPRLGRLRKPGRPGRPGRLERLYKLLIIKTLEEEKKEKEKKETDYYLERRATLALKKEHLIMLSRNLSSLTFHSLDTASMFPSMDWRRWTNISTLKILILFLRRLTHNLREWNFGFVFSSRL